jgi:ubiquinone/menaquinone biosynthesis C-methylase UbiE
MARDYLQSNREIWDQWATAHAKSEFYDLEMFKAGKSSLHSIELDALGDVAGKSLLHLQCHIGPDTLSWARLGATVTGVDFSEEAIHIAQSLADDLQLKATFIQSDIDALPGVLLGEFDIVFTSYGLPELKPWAQVIAHFLKPGGTFFIAEFHPFMCIFEEVEPLKIAYPYFHIQQPVDFETTGSYASPEANVHGYTYEWAHSLSDVINALLGAGLQIQEMGEHDVCVYPHFPGMERDEGGWWRLKQYAQNIPAMFSVKASKCLSK